MTERSPTPLGDKAYLGFLQSFGSVVLGLKRCSADLDRTLYHDLTGKRRKDAKRSLSGEYRVERVTETYFDVSGTVVVSIRDRRDEKSGLSIECTFEGHFHGSPITQEHVERFTKSQLRIVLWPYFRQFVSDMTARMSISPVFLPVYLGGPRATKREKPKAVGSAADRSAKALQPSR